jgi:hypothetical protein
LHISSVLTCQIDFDLICAVKVAADDHDSILVPVPKFRGPTYQMESPDGKQQNEPPAERLD